MNPGFKWMALVVAAAAIAGCEPIVDSRGHTTDAAEFKQIIVGQSRMDDVQAILGSPSTRSAFGDETWYYISEKKETLGPFAPEVVDQKVTAITFDANKVVTTIDEHAKEGARNVEFVEKETPTEGRTLGVFEQLLGNVGRFSGPSTSGAMGPRGPSPMGGGPNGF